MSTPPDPYWPLLPPPFTSEDEICRCDAATPVLLQPHLSPNPLACARCNLEVPPERVGFDEALAKEIASWQQFHDCFYLLWLDSGEFEEWAAKLLRDPASAVISRGMELAREISQSCACYLSWFQDQSADDLAPPIRCPECNGTLEVRFSGERPQGGSLLVCEGCSVALLA
jgi:hypothetical protein